MDRKLIAKWAEEAGFSVYEKLIEDRFNESISVEEYSTGDELERFAALVAAHERAACIRACDTVDLIGADDCIEAIRARDEA